MTHTRESDHNGATLLLVILCAVALAISIYMGAAAP